MYFLSEMFLPASGIKDGGKRPIVTWSWKSLQHFTNMRKLAELFVKNRSILYVS
jgi:hypothetical protein